MLQLVSIIRWLLGLTVHQGIPATVEGVMGGLGRISSADVSGSRKLIKEIQVCSGTHSPSHAHVPRVCESVTLIIAACLQATFPDLKLGRALGE